MEEEFMNRIDEVSAVELSDVFVVEIGEELERSRQELMATVDQLDLAEPLRSDIERSLAEVDGALARIEAGTYGRCSICNGAIPSERLEIMPAADLCVGCRHRRESLAF